jgi:PAS domain S-box-containing protein
MEVGASLVLLYAALDATADGILVTDLTGAILHSNWRFAEMWRVAESTLTSRDAMAGISEAKAQLKDPDGFVARIQELLASPENDVQDVLEFADGRVFERTSRPLMLHDRCAGIVWTFHDATERMRQQAELAAAEVRYRTLIEQSIVGIYVIQDTRFTYVNPKMAEILGYTQAEMTSRPVFDFIAPEDRGTAQRNIKERLDGSVPSIHYTLFMLHRNGSKVHAEVHGTRIVLDGKPTILGTLLDLAMRKG